MIVLMLNVFITNQICLISSNANLYAAQVSSISYYNVSEQVRSFTIYKDENNYPN